MFFGEWITVFVAVSCVTRRADAFPEEGALPLQQLDQNDSETILRAQTLLRRHLIGVLSRVREKVLPEDRIYSIVNRIVQGLQNRDLSPLNAILDENHPQNANESNVFKMAKIIHRLQGCSGDGLTLENWDSFLQTISGVGSTVSPLSSSSLSRRHFQKIKSVDYVNAVLIGIQKDGLKVTTGLLGDILYNYRFRNYSPDTSVVLENFIRLLEEIQLSFQDFRTNPETEEPEEILSDILKYVLSKQDVGVSQSADRILSALSRAGSVEPLREGPAPWSCLHLMSGDDYPPDIIRAKDELVVALERGRTRLDWTAVQETLRGFSPLEKLLGLMSRLTLIPKEEPLTWKIHAIYAHVKLRHLSSQEKFFRPQTPSDIDFLLNSFVTLTPEINPAAIKAIHNIFLQPEFPWNVLAAFDFSKFSRPRSQVIGILRELLKNEDKFPASHLVRFRHFITHYTENSKLKSDYVALGGKLSNPAGKTSPTSPPKLTTTMATQRLPHHTSTSLPLTASEEPSAIPSDSAGLLVTNSLTASPKEDMTNLPRQPPPSSPEITNQTSAPPLPMTVASTQPSPTLPEPPAATATLSPPSAFSSRAKTSAPPTTGSSTPPYSMETATQPPPTVGTPFIPRPYWSSGEVAAKAREPMNYEIPDTASTLPPLP